MLLRPLISGLTCLVALIVSPQVSRAGGGPENVLLVVNDRSFVSLTLGNYYARLRNLPPSHVLHVSWDRNLDGADVAAFREAILGTALTAIQQRGLGDQIDYLVYSSDFPPAIDYEVDMRRTNPGKDKAVGSLTSLTYFYQAVMDGQVNAYASLTANQYFQSPASDGVPPSRAFRGDKGWLPGGAPSDQPRPRYLLSTMLSVTSGRGISLRESVDMLRVSATADGTAPPGVIYFMVSDDVRTKVRSPSFLTAIAELQRLGVEGVTLPGVLPLRRNNVAGAMLGNATLPLGQAQLKILPGAICENLTSTGAMFTENSHQTPCTELLRYGAAGTSGTVIEPFAIAQKFPTAFIQVHYARGCSLGEAFYQSVQGPFQLLIVGDPLCQPWARAETVALASLEPGATVRGVLELSPTLQGEAAPARWQLFVDGRRASEAADGQSLRLDTTALLDGFHEVRTVALGPEPLETQSRAIVGVNVDNQGRSVAFSTSQPRCAWGQKLELTAASSGAAAIDIRHGGRSLGVIGAASGTMTLDPRVLGLGPVRLQAVALSADKAELAVSAPVSVDVGPGPPLPAASAPAGLTPGLCVLTADGARRVVPSTLAHKWLEDAGVGANQDYQIEAWFDVDAPDIYQFQVRHAGQLELQVDGQTLFSGRAKFDRVAFVPAVLAQGAHRLTMRGNSGGAARLDLRFGGPGALHVAAPRFSCER